ncbi:hypothetical protein ACFOEY_15505 [Paracandidimonas soli]|uniref:hypothetical protein n=1 Tax=Paracandidimonas soli TaxID=1917182 RepID=UPI00360FC400
MQRYRYAQQRDCRHHRAPWPAQILDVLVDAFTNPMEPTCPAAALVYNNPLCTYPFRSAGQKASRTGPASKARPAPIRPAFPHTPRCQAASRQIIVAIHVHSC